MIFRCIGCPKTKVGRHDRTAYVQDFVCISCQKKGVKLPPLFGEKATATQSPSVVMRPRKAGLMKR